MAPKFTIALVVALASMSTPLSRDLQSPQTGTRNDPNISETDRRWTRFRLSIYQKKSPNDALGCFEQHIREHVYARAIDNELSQAPRTAFVVDARSALDKIVISIDLLISPAEHARLAERMAKALSRKPTHDLLLAESRLVAIEERAHAARPSLADTFFDQLAPTVLTPSLRRCSRAISPDKFEQVDWAPRAYRLDQIVHAEMPRRMAQFGGHQPGETKDASNFDYRAVPIRARAQSGADPEDALFVGLREGEKPRAHLLALADLYRIVRTSGHPAPNVRPFGTDAFIVLGDRHLLNRVRNAIEERSALSVAPKTDTILASAALQWAHRFICTKPSPRGMSPGAWADAVAIHPYYEFWLQADACKSESLSPSLVESLSATAPPELYVQGLSQASKPRARYRVANLKYRFCFNATEDDTGHTVSRETMLSAMRQYFRMNLGHALNILERDRAGACSVIGFISPVEHHAPLRNALETFDYRSKPFTDRLLSAWTKQLCDNGVQPCPDLKSAAFKTADKPMSLRFTLKAL